MNYKKIYSNIIEKYKKLNLQKDGNIYLETHHIIPKCIGGSNNKDNLVNLTAKAHFICHLLLPKIYKNDFNKYIKLYQALFMMSVMKNNYQKRYIITSKQYIKIREEYSNFRHNTKQTYESNKKRRDKLLGRIPWNKGFNKNNNDILKSIGLKVSNSNKGKKFSDSHKKNISLGRKLSNKVRGKNNIWYGTKGPMYGRHHTKERNKKMSDWMKLNNPFKGKHHTEKSKKINSEKIKMKWKDQEYRNKIMANRKLKVICLETGVIYSNTTIASRITKIKKIGLCCKGEIETAGGFHWKYYHEISPV